jgi:hypothetical protein
MKLKCLSLKLRPGMVPDSYTRSRTRHSHPTLMGAATYPWIKWKTLRQTLTSGKIHASAAAHCVP